VNKRKKKGRGQSKLPHGKVLKTHLLGTIAQDGVECELMSLCVFGLARYPCTGCIHIAAYLSVGVTSGCVEVQRGGLIG
jgi:hypothetical protein